MVYTVVAGAVLLLAAWAVLRWRRGRAGEQARRDDHRRLPDGRRILRDGHRPTGTARRLPAAARRLVGRAFGRKEPGYGPGAPTAVTVLCIRCQGRGWIDRRERTLTFTGEGFADVDHPAAMCETCGGSGRVTR